MKTRIHAALGLAFSLALVPLASAQSTSTRIVSGGGTATAVSTTTTNGTVSEVKDGTLTIRSAASPQPIQYRFDRSTSYVDEFNVPVAAEVVEFGVPVTVEYVLEGNQMIASRVIVRRASLPSSNDLAPTVVEQGDRVIEKPAVVEKPSFEKKTTTTTTTTR